MLIDSFSCHSQHFQHYRAWLICYQLSHSDHIQCREQRLFWSLTVYFNSRFSHLCIQWWRLVVIPSIFSCCWARPWNSWSTHVNVELGSNISFKVQPSVNQQHQWRYELLSQSRDVVMLPLHHSHVCIQYGGWSDPSADLLQGIKWYLVSLSLEYVLVIRCFSWWCAVGQTFPGQGRSCCSESLEYYPCSLKTSPVNWGVYISGWSGCRWNVCQKK